MEKFKTVDGFQVDDEEQLLLTMQAGFEPYREHFEVLTARNGKEACALLAATRVNLVRAARPLH